ncbi:hypothetical protein [Bifidobacterium cuniculi]|uniref:M-like protein Szp3 n=1 Tax=Bifidobacterium cuniculi TaxID=1688 RepID=A0A087AYM8_9BIFI|nr:hypothetical protein [Bifidobacterium cuniculi]KFI63878.1 M-like protein Szp3 [Bifidobacterium cuniculi]
MTKQEQTLPTERIVIAEETVPSYVPPAPPARKRRRWPIVVAVLVVLAIVGGVIYANQHTKALERCRGAVTSFSGARKSLIDTTENTSGIRQFIQGALGVDDALDAVAKAMDAAEGTVSEQGCATNATITQLNLVANVLDSATDSLNDSVAQMKKQAKQQASELLGGTSDPADGDASGSAKDTLNDSIARGKTLVERLRSEYADSGVATTLANGLQSTLDAGQQLVERSGVTDTKLYKAAKVTLDEAMSAANAWIDAQAAKAK